jgi:hypothetical protein
MYGYPKHLNSKEDYLYVKDNFPREQWLPDWQALLDSSRNWFVTGELESEEAGVTDETHKVIVQQDTQGEDETKKYYQAEWQYDPNCKMSRLGFTRKEVEDAIAG